MSIVGNADFNGFTEKGMSAQMYSIWSGSSLHLAFLKPEIITIKPPSSSEVLAAVSTTVQRKNAA